MNSTIKTVLALIFAILLFSWLLSVMPSRDGFEPTIDTIDQINYMTLAQNPKNAKQEPMDDQEDDINARLAMLNDNQTESQNEQDPAADSSETMLNMSPYH